MKKSILVALAAFSLVSGNLYASGGGGYGNDNSSYSNAVDHKYQRGKAHYFSKDTNGNRRNFCVKSGDDLVRLTGNSVRAFSSTTADELRNSIYLCDSSELAKEQLSRNQMSSILYYLNKRYKLSLS